jgi:hypothetical protein
LEVFLNNTSSSAFSFSTKEIFIEDAELRISHFGNSTLTLASRAISLIRGRFNINAPSRQSKVEILMNGSEEVEPDSTFTDVQKSLGFNFIGAEQGSSIEFKGSKVDYSFVRLSKNMNINDEWITLDHFVNKDWNIGDYIAVGPTGFF